MSSTPPVEKKFSKGEDLFCEGGPGTEAYLLIEGYVTVWRMEGDNKVVLATRAEGDIVGEYFADLVVDNRIII